MARGQMSFSTSRPIARPDALRRCGVSVTYTVIAFTALSGVVSLAVDFGRVRLVKAELQNAADAAARYGVQGLSDNTAVAKAQSAASQNTADGTPQTLQSGDVQTGNWDSVTNAFTPGGTPLNAVKVTACRTVERGNAVQTLFAKLVGFDLDPVSWQMVKDGKIDALVVQDPFKMGHEGMNIVLTNLTGGKVPEFMGLGTNLLTKENADQFANDPQVTGK